MACLVAVNFSSFPIFTAHTELLAKQSAHPVFSSLWSRRASSSPISCACIWKYTDTAMSNLSSVDLTVPSMDMSVIFPFQTDVSNSPRTLCGYWVGPDMEDGWGFVEASISGSL